MTDTREKVGIFQQDKTKVWTALLKISYTCFITSPEDTCQGLHSCSTDSKRYLQGDVPHLPLVQIQIKWYRYHTRKKKKVTFFFLFFFFSFWCAGSIISFLVLETLIKESQFSWMSYKHVYLIGFQREIKLRFLMRQMVVGEQGRRMNVYVFTVYVSISVPQLYASCIFLSVH